MVSGEVWLVERCEEVERGVGSGKGWGSGKG